jgi:hypothetical protein
MLRLEPERQAGGSLRRRVRFDRISILIVITVLGFFVPALVDLCSSSWKRRAFGWVASDAFYYLTVARNAVQHGRMAYDQVHLNNGFHPLWQLLCAGLAVIVDGPPGHDGLVLGVVLLGVALAAAAIPLVAWTLTASNQRLSVFFPLLPIGAYALLIIPVWARGMPSMAHQNGQEGPMPLYGTLWSQANGMESALVVFFFALAGWLFVHRDLTSNCRRACAFGLTLSSLVLSRLDHLLLVIPLLGAIAISVAARRGWTWPLTFLLGAFCAPIGLYVLANHYFYGVLAPTSGTLKSNFPHINNQNLDDLIAFWKGPWRGKFLTHAYRHFAAAVPAIIALLYLAVVLKVRPLGGSVLVRLRDGTNRCHAFIALIAPGIILLAFYDTCFVSWEQQGHWYFPASVSFVSLAFLSLSAPLEEKIAGLARRRSMRWGPRSALILWSVWLASCAVCVVAVFVRFHCQSDYHRAYADFYLLEAPKIRAHYGDEMPHFVECDDGIIAYSLGAPTMSNFLGLDPAGIEARERGDLLGLALERKYDRLTTLEYGVREGLGTNPSGSDLTTWAKGVVNFDDKKPYAFALDYRSADGHFAIVKASRK